MKHVQQQRSASEGEHVTSRLLRCFVTGAANRYKPGEDDGNPCRLYCLDGPPDGPPPASGEHVQCQSWPAYHKGKTAVEVKCFGTDGALIQCCGHGLLGAAYHWQRHLKCDELCLLMNDSVVSCWREDDICWLRFKTLPTRPCPVPDWTEQVFGANVLPQAAAVAGDEQGYLVLQWPDSFDLSLLCLPGKALSERSQRALICTSAQPEHPDGEIRLRYFAPQYGVAEDTATGSAMRILADYWSFRYTTLTAYQCSTPGGSLLSRFTPTHIEVGGRCVSSLAAQADA